MQLLPTIMPSVGSYGTSVENKGFRLKSLFGKTSLCTCVHPVSVMVVCWMMMWRTLCCANTVCAHVEELHI